MGKPRTGTFEPWDAWPSGLPRFRFRLRLGDGTKTPRFDVPEGMAEPEARAHVALMQATEDAHGGLLKKKRDEERSHAEETRKRDDDESVDAWFKRYLPSLECGENHRRITGHVWKKWISPLLGAKTMRTLTRDEVEDVRDALDRALDAKDIRHGTARNAWATLTGALKAASASRDRSLRVHAAPLHFGLLPPKRGDSRQRPWLYPNEWRALAECTAIHGEWRCLYAISLYTGLRPNELRALTWDDVDTKARQLSVSKAWDEQAKGPKPPKTSAGHRTIPIEPALLPLLEALRGEKDGTAAVAPLLSTGEDRIACTFRDHLAMAKVKRARLSADNATEEPVDFRSLRDSYATWLALAGVPDKRIQRRLGHASNTTTDRYIKAAEAFDVAAIGEPFPTIPESLWPSHWPKNEKTPGKRRGSVVARVGFEKSADARAVERSPTSVGESTTTTTETPRYPVDASANGPAIGPPADPVTLALARALELAVAAGEDVVAAELAHQIAMRRART